MADEQLKIALDELAKRNVELQEQLQLIRDRRADAVRIIEEQRESLRKLPELEEALRVEREDHERTQRRLGARERELEQIRGTQKK